MISIIKVDDVYKDEDNNEITYYFIANKDLLKQYHIDEPEAIHSEIKIVLPLNNQDPKLGDCQISPTVEIEEGWYEDTDWHDIDLTYDEKKELLRIAKEEYYE